MSETLRVLADEELPYVAGGSIDIYCAYPLPYSPYDPWTTYMTYEQYMALYGQYHPTP